MTEPHNPQHAAPEPESQTEAPETETAPDVAELSQNLTEAREAADAAKTRGDAFYHALHLATMQQATSDLLHAVSDMPDDDPRYRDDNGFPSLDGMREVAEELIAAKPYMARVRGNVEQGPKESRTEASWSDVFRQAVGDV